MGYIGIMENNMETSMVGLYIGLKNLEVSGLGIQGLGVRV